MPTSEVTTISADHRLFGFDAVGRVRANLYHGHGFPYAGSLYSWVMGATVEGLANKLERTWEQPLSDAEWDAVQELCDSYAAVCATCGGSGADPGAIDPAGEPCPTCSGRRPNAENPGEVQPTAADAFEPLRRSLGLPQRAQAETEAA